MRTKNEVSVPKNHERGGLGVLKPDLRVPSRRSLKVLCAHECVVRCVPVINHCAFAGVCAWICIVSLLTSSYVCVAVCECAGCRLVWKV